MMEMPGEYLLIESDGDAEADGELTLYPVWRKACAEAREAFGYGDIIPHAWLMEHLEIERADGLMTAAEHQRLAFDLLRKMDLFRAEMLERHKMYLVNIRGYGYKIVEPPHQTSAAMRQLHRDLMRAIGKTTTALINVNDAALSLEDARENAEARAKLAALRCVHVAKLEAKEGAQ